jgi:hypothetical protein
MMMSSACMISRGSRTELKLPITEGHRHRESKFSSFQSRVSARCEWRHNWIMEAT